jgi:hypothetical protein
VLKNGWVRGGLTRCEESERFLLDCLEAVTAITRTVVTGVSEERTCYKRCRSSSQGVVPKTSDVCSSSDGGGGSGGGSGSAQEVEMTAWVAQA